MKSILYAFFLLIAWVAMPSYAVMTPDDDDDETDTTATDSTSLQASLLEMPNAFSPNDDGINDTYHAKKYQNITEFRAWIFNRWGHCLYTWNDINGSWDGKFNGRPVKDGVYFVRVKAKGGDGKEYDIKKDVNILRKYNQITDGSHEQ